MKSSSSRILITGSNGQLANAIKMHSQAKNFQIFSFSHLDLDITDIANIHNAINGVEPDIIVNTAAYTAVDQAEKESEICMRVNHLGPLNLAIASRANNIPLIHLSTDYVFDGKKKLPYVETDKAKPINLYGKSKLMGEQAIIEHCSTHIILRVSGIFSQVGNNFYKTILRLAKERKILTVVCDQITCPTSADDIASAILKICKTPNKFGTYHYCSNQPTSWYDFASNIVIAAQQYMSLELEDLQAITSDEYPTLAQRPAYSVLNCKKIKKDYGIEQKPWDTAVKMFIKASLAA